ncbi:MAG: Ig domain-containing protein, partial [Deltaproteobacteria bacterium]|nr:Ig domain-containing protein [Deltaproteobacteria bacterium]
MLSSPRSSGRVVATVALLWAACGGFSACDDAKSLISVTLTPSKATLQKGATQQLTATAGYDDEAFAVVTGEATWTSSNEAVVTVSAAGLATAVAEGTAVIQAAYSGFTAKATIDVTAATLVSIALTPADVSVGQGATATLMATGSYSDATTKDLTAEATWSTSDASKATVSAGVVTGVAAGTATITASVGAVSGEADVTVSEPVLESIAVTPINPSIEVGSTRRLTATGSYSDDSTRNITTEVTWSSSREASVTVDAGGLVTAVAVGSATIL